MVATCVSALSAPAARAITWRAAVPVPGTAQAGLEPSVVFSPDGTGAIALLGNPGQTLAAPLAADVPAAAVPVGQLSSDLIPDGASAVATGPGQIVQVTDNNAIFGPATFVDATTAGTSLAEGLVDPADPVLVAETAPDGRPVLATNAAGTTATVLFDDKDVTGGGLYLALAAPGGGFTKPIEIDKETTPVATVAVSAQGVVLVAWLGLDGLYTRERLADGELTSPKRVGPQVQFLPQIAATFTSDGLPVIAWEHEAGLSPSRERWRWYAAVGSSSGRFGAPQSLDRGIGPKPTSIADTPPSDLSPLLLTASADGSVSALWTSFGAGHYVVREATATNGHFGAARSISNRHMHAFLDAACATPSGGTMALWTTAPLAKVLYDAEHAQLVASYRPPGASAFQRPLALTPPRGAVYEPSIAADPQSGLVMAAWLGRDSLEEATATP